MSNFEMIDEERSDPDTETLLGGARQKFGDLPFVGFTFTSEKVRKIDGFIYCYKIKYKHSRYLPIWYTSQMMKKRTD